MCQVVPILLGNLTIHMTKSYISIYSQCNERGMQVII